MYVHRKTAKRFSLLLLGNVEDYIQEYVCVCVWPNNISGNFNVSQEVHGNLQLCTKSIFFEPDDVRLPLVQLPFSHISHLEPIGGKSFSVTCSKLTKMKANNQDTPYIFERNKESTWEFHLPHVVFEKFISLAMEQMSGRNDEMLLLEKCKMRQQDFHFDTSRLVSFSETIICESLATQLTPLVREPGKLVLTNQRLYFQPMHNISGSCFVRSHLVSGIAATARRRSSLRQVGLEIFFMDSCSESSSSPSWEEPSAFFCFEHENERELWITQILKSMGNQELQGRVLDPRGSWLRDVCNAWQQGRVSNFDYLLFLNLISGRTFNDLAQWPVFPWVIADYESPVLDLSNPNTFRDLSKPIGALNPARLESFRARYKEMPTNEEIRFKFLYGTHYSTPGYVMYWLVRSAPAHMLQLQNGKFDAPDRLFSSIKESWHSVTHNQADLKELIPEFFLPNPAFLINEADLALGKRQNGKMVDDVELPPWADNPLDFLSKHRCALESPHVSATLHSWIDLIFGYKQQGEDAIAADNVFYYLCYEGSIDIDNVKDDKERRVLEAQINEFGQTPMQLFRTNHPQRLVFPLTPSPSQAFETAGSASSVAAKPVAFRSHFRSNSIGHGRNAKSENKALTLALLRVLSNQSLSSWSEAIQTNTETHAFVSSAAALNGSYKLKENEEVLEIKSKEIDEVSPYNLPYTRGLPLLVAPIKIPTYDRVASNGFIAEEEGNMQSNSRVESEAGIVYWREYIPNHMQQVSEFKFLYGAVNAVAVSGRDSGILYCAGDAAGLRLFSLRTGEQLRSTRITKNEGDLSEFPFSSMALLHRQGFRSSNQPLVLLGSHDNCVYVYSVDHGRLLGFFEAHEDIVSGIEYLSDGQKQDRLITSSWDCTVKIWSLADGSTPWDLPLIRKASPEMEISDHDSSIWDMAVNNQGTLLVTGTDEGIISTWDLRDATRPVWKMKHGNDYIGGVAFLPSYDDVALTSGNGKFHLLSSRKSGACIATASYGQPLKRARTDGILCLSGAADGSIGVWDMGIGPPLQALGNTNTPSSVADGLLLPLRSKCKSAVNDIYVSGFGQKERSLVIATGHEDGTVTIFASENNKSKII